MMIEDIKLSSLESAEEMFLHEHKHFPHYIPLVIAGMLFLLGVLFYQVSLQSSAQVAGISTEDTSVEVK